MATIYGTVNDDTLVGTDGIDSIFGLGGNDTIDGGASGDFMYGGTGSDVYLVDNVDDLVSEQAGEGVSDAVVSAISYKLRDNVEYLSLLADAGTGATGTGNAAANSIYGNQFNNELFGLGGVDYLSGGGGSDSLNGGTEADTMEGGAGDDFYDVDNVADIAREEDTGSGYDTVYATVSYTLYTDVEALRLLGTAIAGTGNASDNSIIGNDIANYLYGLGGVDSLQSLAGDDFLDGGAGADLLEGGQGNDTYYVDDAADKASETVDAGYDRVRSTVNYTLALAPNIEELRLIGAATNGVGNELANWIYGNELNNNLWGEDGSDYLEGGGGIDVLIGGAGADLLVGNLGSDTLFGGLGSDTLIGGVGSDSYLYYTGDGFDTILDSDGQGSIVSDGATLGGGAQYGDQRVFRGLDAGGVNHLYTFISGNRVAGGDLIVDGAMLIKSYVPTAGSNLGIALTDAVADANPVTTLTISGDIAPNDVDPDKAGIQATPDALLNPVGTAQPYEDRLFGSSGNDRIQAGEMFDLVAAGDGNDWVEGGNGNDYLIGGLNDLDGHDLMEGGTGRDILLGYGGNDRLYANIQIDIAAAIANGNNNAGSGLPGEWLSGGAGDDKLVADAGNDVLAGGAGNDLLVAGAGDDLILGDADYMAQYFMTSPLVLHYELVLGVGSWFIWNTISPDTFNWAYTDINDQITFTTPVTGELSPAGSGVDVVYAGAGDDYVFGGAGADVLFGEKGADRLSGDTGNDLLIGGADDDKLWGGEGSDILIGGAGQDILKGGAGKDTYVFNAGDVVGNEFIDDTIHTANSAEASVLVLNGYRRDQIKFREGSLMVDLGDGGAIHFNGFAPSDPLSTPVLDSIQFDDGTSMSYQDVLDQGFDLDGTEDNDFIFGTAVTDRIDGKGGDDVLVGDSGDDVLTGGTGEDELFGEASEDRLIGGEGADYMDGGEGRDTYVFNRGDGADLVDEVPQEEDFSDASALQLGEGIEQGDVKFRLDDDRNLVVDLGQEDKVAFASFSASNPVSTPVLDAIQFDGGLSMSYADILAQGFDLDGTEDDDFIRGTGVTDRVEGMDGNDILITEAGDDVLHGGAGDDALSGGEGDDLLDGGSDDDVLQAGDGDDVIDGGTGNDTIYGGEGNDTLIGGEGFDSLNGDAGDDSIFAGDGDTVIDTLGENHLDLTAYTALTATNLEITQYQADGGDLFLNMHVRDAAHLGETPDTGGVSFVGGIGSFATVVLNDGAGSTVTLTGSELGAYIAGGIVISGTAFADTMSGTGGDDTIESLDGADTIDAGAGNDRIDGGTGDDTLIGGDGNDTYLLSLNGGHDTVIEDGGAEPDSTNTVQLDAGITTDMLAGARLGDDLRIQVKATGDSLLVKDFYTQPQSWQDGWSIVDGDGASADIGTLLESEIPTAEEWLEAQKEEFKDRRLQVFASARISERLAPDGEGKYQRIDRGFSYEAGQATSTTTVSWLTAPETIYLDGDQQSIDTSYLPVHSTSITASVQLVSQSVLQSTGSGRSAPQATFGTSNGGLPNPFFIPAGSTLSIQQGPGITVVPVFGAYIGVPPRDEFGRIDPNAQELKGYYVYTGSAPTPSSSPLAQRLIQNVVETVALATTHDTHITVTDVVASGSLSYDIVAMNSVVEAGSGDDSILLTTTNLTTSTNPSESLTLNSFRLPMWQPDVSLNSLIDTHSPSAAQWRFGNMKNPGGATVGVRYGDMSLPGLRTLGAFVDAGAGDDEINGGIDASEDEISGSGAGDDTIAGGDGNDVIDGGAGADTYLYSADESGIDVLTESASIDLRTYGDWYYWNRGILNWDERLEFGGMYRHGGNEFNEGVSYWDTPEEAWEEFYVGTPLDYIDPLTETPPPLTRNDTAAMNALMDAGVLPRDVVKFGPGLSLSDLELSVSVDSESLADHPEQPWYTGGTLSVRWGNAGFDTEIPDAVLRDPLDIDGTTLGEGIEAFEFADGTSYTLEEILNAATVTAVIAGTIVGTEGDDYLFGTVGDDYVLAGDGSDTVIGGQGNDTIIGGPGEFDELEGGDGDDTYVYNPGDGIDGVYDYAGDDTVQFGAGISPSDILVTQDPWGTLYLEVGGPDNRLELYGWFDEENKIEHVKFADGTAWDATELEARITTAPATDLGDILFLSDGNDVVDGLAGDDWIFGNDGNDALFGGADDDYMEGGAGANLMAGGSGADYIYTPDDGAASVVLFNAGDGEDTLSDDGVPIVLSLGGVAFADIKLDFSDGDDGSLLRLSMGATDGVALYGYSFADSQWWPSGKLQLIGSDIRTYDLNAVVQAFYDALAQDPQITQWSAADALQDNLISVSTTEAYGGELAYQYATTGGIGGLTTAQQQALLGSAEFGLAPQPIVLAAPNHAPTLVNALMDQSAMENATFSFIVPENAFADADAGDTLSYSATRADGTELPSWLSFDAATRTFSGTPGAGDAGALEIRVTASDAFGASAEDEFSLQIAVPIVGTESDDYLEGTEGADVIYAGGGYDTVEGMGGDDTIYGGADDDELSDVSGDDTYVHARGDGFDWIYDEDGFDTLRFAGDVAPGEVLVTRDPYGSLYLEIGSLEDVVAFEGWFADEYNIEQVAFSDGTVWDAAEIEARVTTTPATSLPDLLYLSDTNDVAHGLAGGDWIYGNGGNDALFGDEGDDTLQGGTGANLLAGGAGDDYQFTDDGAASVVLFNAGDGEDFVNMLGGPVVVSLGGVTLSDITLEAGDWDFMRIGMGAGGGIVTYSYGADSQSWPSGTLQLIGTDIRTYDFNAVVQAFFDARAQNPAITQWSAADALQDNLLSVSTTEAYGGALAYQYATTGSVGGLTAAQQQSVVNGTDFGIAPQPIADVQEGNTAPVVSASDTTVLLGQSVSASSLFSVADAENNAMTQYEFWDSTSGNGHFTASGVEQGVNVSIVVPSSSLQDTFFVSGSATGTDQVWVRANDGQTWSDWKSWNVASAPHLTNSVPLVSASGGELLVGDSVAASGLFSVTDADSDAITQYEFWDDVAGGGHFSLGGVAQGNNPIPVSSTQFADLNYVAGSSPGTEQLWVRASDGIGWGAWKNWNMTSALHTPDAAPEVTPTAATQTVTLGQSADASSLFAVSDADGDPITQYEFWDSTSGNGHFAIDGIEQGVNAAIPVSSSELSEVSFEGSQNSSSDQVWVRASDGQKWGDWKSWTMNSWTHAGNSAPVVTAGASILVTDEVASASSLFSVTDADGDSIARYEFWDDVNGGGYFRVNGVQQGAAQTIAVAEADLAGTEYVGGANPGTEQVWVRASDGMEWGAWKPWNMTTALHVPNAAPAVTASDSTVLLNDAVAAAGLFSVTDADNDAITQYEFWDSTAGNGHFAVNGVAQGVNVSIVVSAANLADTEFVASGSAGSDQVWVRANDGQVWSDWKSWNVNSWPHMTNAAPVVTASTYGLLRNEAVGAADLFSVSDADGDSAALYEFWDDVNGGGHFELDGVQQAAGQSILVTAANLAQATYEGGSNPGTEQVWARVNDGMGWSNWKNWLMATEGGMLRGGDAPDTLNGDPDTPVLEGGAGDDTLNAGDPNSLLSGGDGADTLNGGAGDDLLAGGTGDDTISTGAGSNVIAINAGEGTDTVYSTAGSSNTLSMGGGIDYNDLSLSKDGNDLVLNTGASDSVRLKDWYNGKDTVENLQLILDATNDYDANSSDPLYNSKVQTFDFRGMVNQFDQALAASPGLTSWAVTNALLQYHLSGADDAALGGDLAYWYGKNSGFTGISLAAAQQAIGATGFGSDAQQLHAFNGLQEGLVKLA